jgi:reductive dehalogenase
MKHHLYSTGGRKHNYGEPVVNNHKYAIAFTVEMDFSRVKSAPKGPIIMESSAQYLRAGNIAVQIAAFLRNMGYPARAHIDGKYQVRCPEVAKDAGLGELGRMSLLMTPELGPRVRIGVVTTDFPMKARSPGSDPTMIRFCRICKKCALSCPAQAISYDDPKPIGGAIQWVINQEECYTYWCKTGTDCGRCISVCPYSHPDNLLHRIVRYFIKTSPLFLVFAARMDDWLYTRKPPVRNLPEWMDSK